MKTLPGSDATEKKGHICPPSDAQHPCDRWETAFVYAFITKFTNMRSRIEGFESPMDLEDALMSPIQHPYLLQILSHFVLNLKPQTRNLGATQISSTVQSVLQEYLKSSERTVFWSDDLRANIDPLEGIEGGIWGADWDLKLRILRQLVELQLSHHAETRDAIDRAWGVVHNKHKKKDPLATSQNGSESNGVNNLFTSPIGQDLQRRRYWFVDDSPRLYVSSNPWKVTATFKAIASTREEYLQTIGDLKDKAPTEPKENEKKSKLETSHLGLVKNLQTRLETIDAELARVQKVRRKIEQIAILKAQGEVRETRTRRQTRRPDYVYDDPVEDEDDGDEYMEVDDDDGTTAAGDDDFLDDGVVAPGHSRVRSSTRRSRRSAAMNGRTGVNIPAEWRAERRSSRLEKVPEARSSQPPVKRARTDSSGASTDMYALIPEQKPAVAGAATVKPHEVVVEQVAGKKKSKFWYYAVETVPGMAAAAAHSTVHSTPKAGGEMFDMNALRDTCDVGELGSNVSEQTASSDGMPGGRPYNVLERHSSMIH